MGVDRHSLIMQSAIASPVEIEGDEDALIEQGFTAVSKVLSVLARALAEAELLFEPLTLSKL